MKTLIDSLIGWPERGAQHLGSLVPLFARIVVGWVASAPNRCPRATGVAPYSSQAVPVDISHLRGSAMGRSADVTTFAPSAANLTALAASIPRDPPVTRAT